MLSQWVLRNFRSDDTAHETKHKQRVWCHIINGSDVGNEIKEIPLPISSIGINKDFFMLKDPGEGAKFDIESELSEYERRTSILFNQIIHEHKFEKLLDINRKGNALEEILNFMVIQMLLGLNNPQNKNPEKDELFNMFVDSMVENFDRIETLIINPPEEIKEYYSLPIYQKILRVVASESSAYEKCKALFILYMLTESQRLPTLFGHLSNFRNQFFEGIHITGVYHTGYDFDSTEIRPVFTIGPNVFTLNEDNNMNFLPISHNIAIGFSIGKHQFYNSDINIFSVNPNTLKCNSDKLNIYKVSHDYIDNITTWINMGNVGYSKTIYTPYELKNVEDYLALQNENRSYFYEPSEPELIAI